MLRRWLHRIALSVCLACGAVAWVSLSLRATNEWVFHTTRGMWFDDMRDLSPREVAIVPGNVFRNGRPNRILAERLWLALSLYQAGRVGSFLVSGDEERAGHEASGMKQWLVDRGVPASRVMVDRSGVRTLATMNRAAHVFGIRSAIICTQSWAAPRALFLAAGSGIDALAFVPRGAPVQAPSGGMGGEDLKISLAFVERYVLRRTAPGSAATASFALTTLRTYLR